MVDATFQWEDGGMALCSEVKCSCGERIDVDEIVESGLGYTVECPECGKVYGFRWVGMETKEV